jgi:hypothetical protein
MTLTKRMEMNKNFNSLVRVVSVVSGKFSSKTYHKKEF